MAMNQSDNQDGINDINITPFVDVVLVLLVIFMVTAPMMIKEGLKVELPQTTSADKMNPSTLSLMLTKNGQIIMNGQLMTEQAMLELIMSKQKTENNIQVIIGADLEATHGMVVNLMDQLKRIGIQQMAFQVVREEKNQ